MFANIRDQLSLQNIRSFLKDIQNLIFFVKNVSLKESILQYNERGFRKVKQFFEEAVQTHGIKVISPLRILLLRVLDQNLGYIELHTLFLQFCNKFQVPKQALSILQRNSLFRYMNKAKISDFLEQGCDIYIKLGEYKRAHELIQRGKYLQSNNSESSLKVYSRIIVLQINMKGQIQTQSEIKQKLRFLLLKRDFENELINTHNQELYNKINFKLQFYASLTKYRELTQVQEKILSNDGLLAVYQNSKWTSLRKYIDEEIKGINWRIKTQQIKDKHLADIQVVTGINKNQQICRYDCKNKILYFNHKESDQEKLNNLITLAMNMSEEVLNCKFERKQHNPIGIRGIKMRGWGSQIQFFKRHS